MEQEGCKPSAACRKGKEKLNGRKEILEDERFRAAAGGHQEILDEDRKRVKIPTPKSRFIPMIPVDS